MGWGRKRATGLRRSIKMPAAVEGAAITPTTITRQAAAPYVSIVFSLARSQSSASGELATPRTGCGGQRTG